MRSPPLPPGAAWASSGWSVHRRLGGSSTCCCGPTGTPSRQVRAAFGLASPCRLGATSDGHPGDRADNRRSPSPHQGAGCPVALLSAGSQPGDGRRGRAAPGSRRGARGHQPELGSSSAAMPRRAQAAVRHRRQRSAAIAPALGEPEAGSDRRGRRAASRLDSVGAARPAGLGEGQVGGHALAGQRRHQRLGDERLRVAALLEDAGGDRRGRSAHADAKWRLPPLARRPSPTGRTTPPRSPISCATRRSWATLAWAGACWPCSAPPPRCSPGAGRRKTSLLALGPVRYRHE